MPGPSRLWTLPGSNIASSLLPAVVASNLFIGLALVALLYFGRELFVPVVLALLLSFVLARSFGFFVAYMPATWAQFLLRWRSHFC